MMFSSPLSRHILSVATVCVLLLAGTPSRMSAAVEVPIRGDISALYPGEVSIGHLALKMEADAGFLVTVNEYALLDGAVEQAQALVEGFRARASTKEEAVALLQGIAEIVGRLCPVQANNANGGLFSAALRTGACDCDIYTITYLTVAERTGLPLKGMLAPGHMLLVWDDGSTRFLWETTTASERNTISYVVAQRISEVALENGLYLNPLTREQMIGYLFLNRGGDRYEQGDLAGAEADFASALQLHPTNAMAYYGLGLTYGARQDPMRSIIYYTRAIELDPHYADAYFNRAAAYSLLRQHEAALEDYRWIEEWEGKSADTWYGIGIVQTQMGNARAGVKSLGRALRLDPSSGQAYLARGIAYLELDHPRQALVDFDRALALDPSQIRAYYYRGVVHEGSGAHVAAMEALRQYVEAAEARGGDDLLEEARQRLADLTGVSAAR